MKNWKFSKISIKYSNILNLVSNYVWLNSPSRTQISDWMFLFGLVGPILPIRVHTISSFLLRSLLVASLSSSNCAWYLASWASSVSLGWRVDDWLPNEAHTYLLHGFPYELEALESHPTGVLLECNRAHVYPCHSFNEWVIFKFNYSTCLTYLINESCSSLSNQSIQLLNLFCSIMLKMTQLWPI